MCNVGFYTDTTTMLAFCLLAEPLGVLGCQRPLHCLRIDNPDVFKQYGLSICKDVKPNFASYTGES